MLTGIVIGHYNNPEALELNLAAIRHHCGNITVMISDDCSEGFGPIPSSTFSRVIELGEKYNALIWPNAGHLGHNGGDVSAFWKGVVWGKATQLDIVFKLSQRFIFDTPNWAYQWAEILKNSPYATLGHGCLKYNWKVRTEAMGFKVDAWSEPKLLSKLTPRSLGIYCEKLVELLLNDHFGGELYQWGILSSARNLPKDGYLFREANTPDDYKKLAERLGLSLRVSCEPHCH